MKKYNQIKAINDDIIVEESCDNIFADLSCPDAEEALVKSRLVQRIAEIIEERNLTQMQAIAILNIDQSEISKLTRGQLRDFSIDHLFRFLDTLNQVIEKESTIK